MASQASFRSRLWQGFKGIWRYYRGWKWLILIGMSIMLVMSTYLVFIAKTTNVAMLQDALKTVTTIYDKNDQEAGTLSAQKGTYINLDQMSTTIREAVVATEDKRFYQHNGFDAQGIGRALKLVSDNGEHIVIRPLAYVKEKDLIKYAELKQFPIIPCNLCGSQPNLQRQVIGDMLRDWDKRFPGRIESMFSALQNVVPSHLADPELFDFVGLERGQTLKHGGDLAFDSEKMPERYSDGSEEDESEIKITPSKPERKVINILANKPKTCGA